ncbi:MAG: ribonuclease III [Thermoleophilia bacterium]
MTDSDATRSGDPAEAPAPPLLRLIRELPPGLLATALTHSSWVGERSASNERLEFLGDSVLGLSAAAHLFERYPREDEGVLARWKAFVVSRGSCRVVACRLGLDDLVMTLAPGTEEQRAELASAPTALGNLLEALIGACYLEHGYVATQEAVVDAFYDQVTYAVATYVDYKSTLQEHLAASGGSSASYVVVGEDGPPHDRVFTSRVDVGGESLGEGRGRSIKKSEQRAAHQALMTLGVVPRTTLDVKDEYLLDDGTACPAVSDGD